MGKKFIPKLCTICSLATVFSVTPVLFSCGNPEPTPPQPEHEHVLGGYKIDEASHKLYGICSDCGEQFELSDEQFADLEGAIFVKQNGNYELSTKSLDEIVAEAYGSSVDLYIVNGTYEMATWSLAEHLVTVNMHGILNYADSMPKAIFRCVNIAGATPGIPAYYQWHGMTLNVDHVELLGLEQNLSQYGESSWQNLGIQPATLNATDCYLKGCHSTHATGKATFTNCTFDSRGFKDASGSDLAEYGLYTWNGDTEVYNSIFIGDGKTLKIYTDRNIMHDDQYFVISSCTFIKGGNLNNKAAVEIDSSQIQGDDLEYHITLQHSTLNGVVDLWNDKGRKHIFDPDPPS